MSAQEIQFLWHVINADDFQLFEDYQITEECFSEFKENYDWIVEYYQVYNKLPSAQTFVGKFPDIIQNMGLSSDVDYLADQLKEQALFVNASQIAKVFVDKLQTNSFEAIEYIKAEMEKVDGFVSIPKTYDYSDGTDRLKPKPDNLYIPTGFEELDKRLGGWRRGEELVVVFGRTGVGKSYTVLKSLTEAWAAGNNVMFISPEMTPETVGKRIDVLYGHFNYSEINKNEFSNEYVSFIESLKDISQKFHILGPNEIDAHFTIPKIKAICKKNNIQVLAIDGISYIKLEKEYSRLNTTERLAIVSQRLFQLSCQLEIPIIVSVQANRMQDNNGLLTLNNVRDSDAIAHNASRVLGLTAEYEEGKTTSIIMSVLKNRYGVMGLPIKYGVDFGVGDFEYAGIYKEKTKQKENKKKYDFEKTDIIEEHKQSTERNNDKIEETVFYRNNQILYENGDETELIERLFEARYTDEQVKKHVIYSRQLRNVDLENPPIDLLIERSKEC